ncbi:tripartite tricarboxylate transporter TctB family protein [Loktanella agnita]|uniref:tripartite tricarboxylate transporter TctB family protein n=1 Tax=Loktanella agnita TaxID=287097 RepID=UPI00398A4FF7
MAHIEDHGGQSKAARAVSGGVLLAAGLVISFFAWGYPTGSVNQMGPGFIPQTIGVLISLLAIAIIVVDLRGPALERPTTLQWRGLCFVSASIVIFALLVERAGLLPSMFLAVGVSMFADDQAKPLTVLIYAIVAAGLGWLLFLVGLELPIPAFWRP